MFLSFLFALPTVYFTGQERECFAVLNFERASLVQKYPLRFGVEFPQGLTRDANEWYLSNRDQENVPAYTKPVASWPDGSVRWLQIQCEAKGDRYFLDRKSGARQLPYSRIEISRDDGNLRLRNEVLELTSESQGRESFRIQSLADGFELRGRWSLSQASGNSTSIRQHSVFEQTPFRAECQIEERFSQAESSFLASSSVEMLGSLPWVSAHLSWTHVGTATAPLNPLKFEFNCSREFQSVKRIEGSQSIPVRWAKGGMAELNFIETESGKRPKELWVHVEAPRPVLFYFDRFSKLRPKRIRFFQSGKLEIELLPGVEQIQPGCSIEIDFKIALGNLDRRAAFLNLAREPLPITQSTDLTTATRGSIEPNPSDLKAQRDLEKQFLAAWEECSDWRDRGDYPLTNKRWGNMEFDLAYVWLSRFRKDGNREDFVRGREALAHWRSVDVCKSEGPRHSFLPAIHARSHNEEEKFDSAHVWIEGVLLDYALTGNPRSASDAVRCGDALLNLLGQSTKRRRKEIDDAWPVIALSALESFFPGRGYRQAMERSFGLLSQNFTPGSGCIAYYRNEDDQARVNSWILGGVVLEALDKYALWNPSEDLNQVTRQCVEFLIRDCWDAQRHRFSRNVIFDFEEDQVIQKWGRLRPGSYLYLLSGIQRAAVRYKNPEWLSFVKTASKRMAELDWPKEFPGGQYTLWLRAVADD